MKLIPLTQGKFAKVDDEDYNKLMKHKWHAVKNMKSGDFYVVSSYQKIVMHRFIMNTPKGLVTDHINHDTLDHRKINLRNCTHSQNGWNSRPYGLSKYKGVYFNKTNKKWIAAISKYCKRTHIGSFNSEIEAAKAYDQFAIELHEEFAYLNFPESEIKRIRGV